MERAETMSRLVDKGAVGVKGDGDSGVVLSVGHFEPGTEDHAPEGSRIVVEDEDDVIGRLLQLLPCLLAVAQSVDELLVWILVTSA